MADYNSRPFPSKITIASCLIYVTPLLWFIWLGPLWKAASVVSVAAGVWISKGFLRRFFGIVFLLSILIWGGHENMYGIDFPGREPFMLWWYMHWGTRCHADGCAAEAAAQSPKEWE